MSLLSVVGYWNSAYGRLQILLGLSNFIRFLSTLRLGPSRGSPTSALFIDVFRPSSYPRLSPVFAASFRSLSSFRLVGLPARAFLTPDLPQPKLPLVPTSASLSCLRSSSLLRLAPPGVYLKGSRLPFESPSDGTAVCCRARPG